MGVIYLTDKRSVIPRWRSHKLTVSSGELALTGQNDLNSPFDFSVNSLQEQIFSWNKYRTLMHACDLFSSAYVLGLEKEFVEVASFIYENKSMISKKMLLEVENVLGLSKIDEIEVKFDFFTEEGKNKIIDEISTIKKYLKREPKNPLAWMNMGRNYALLGNFEKSFDCVNASLHVNDTENRYILRSAARFFHHLNQSDKAHFLIRNAKNVQYDPWLLSSEISFSSILGRKSRFLKKANEIVNDKRNNAYQISELASALGTIEINNGDYKDAKSYFKTALINPTDNSLAQVMWFQDEISGLFISDSQLQIPLAFEAQSQMAYNGRNYEKAFDYSMRWINDEPYSTRPIRLASYISGTFLNDRGKSIDIIKHGLKVNPNEVHLTNSLCYNLLLEERIDEASKILSKIKIDNVKEEDDRISLIATTGLYFFRTEEIDKGRLLYSTSIDYARKIKNKYLEALAILNYLREEIRLYESNSESKDLSQINKYMPALEKLIKDVNKDDVLVLSEKVRKMFVKIK